MTLAAYQPSGRETAAVDGGQILRLALLVLPRGGALPDAAELDIAAEINRIRSIQPDTAKLLDSAGLLMAAGGWDSPATAEALLRERWIPVVTALLSAYYTAPKVLSAIGFDRRTSRMATSQAVTRADVIELTTPVHNLRPVRRVARAHDAEGINDENGDPGQ